MQDLVRAWRSFRAQPSAERSRLIRQLARHAGDHGLRSALARIRHEGLSAAAADGYPAWCEAHTPRARDLERMRVDSQRFARQPLISILTPVYNTDPRWLDACADSVIAQVYPRWQWCLGNDGSNRPETLEALRRLAGRDARIIVAHAGVNAGISAASNMALARADGEWVALLDSDDALLPHALFRMVEHLNLADGQPDVVYSDEDKLDFGGQRCDAYFKPDWSPELFLSNMFVCHFLMARRALVLEVGGFRSAFDFSQDYDLMLRLMERTGRIDHVADVLYHWRKVPQSGAAAGDAKPAAHVAGRRAIQDHLDRQGVDADVVDAGPAGFYRVRYRLSREPLVSVAAGERLSRDQLGRVLSTATSARTEVAASPAVATGEYLLWLGTDVTPVEGDWLDALLEIAEQPGIGVVAPHLVDGRGRLVDIGLALGATGAVASRLGGWTRAHGGYFGSALAIRNVSAVGGACFLTPRAVWHQVGGFDDSLSPDARAIDYSLRTRDAGFRVAVTPWSSLVANGDLAIGPLNLPEQDVAALRRRWGSALTADPYQNPHLLKYDLSPPPQ